MGDCTDINDIASVHWPNSVLEYVAGNKMPNYVRRMLPTWSVQDTGKIERLQSHKMPGQVDFFHRLVERTLVCVENQPILFITKN